MFLWLCFYIMETTDNNIFQEQAPAPASVPENVPATITKANVGDKAIAKISSLIEGGFTLPVGYNYVNAIKQSIITLSETKDKASGKSVLEVCTTASIYSALLDMAQKGLDASKGQGFFNKRGDKLVFQKEYHGTTTLIQRLFPNYTPNPRVVYQGDVFEYDTDPKTGRRSLVKHEQKLENLDNDFVAAYLYIPCRDGGQDLFIMTKKMILAAWTKSSSKEFTTHKQFTEKMVCKTIINSGLEPLIKSSDSKKGDNIITAENPEDAKYEYVDADSAAIDEQ